MQKYVIALYIRLSVEDSKTKSLSIPSQRHLLHNYIESKLGIINGNVEIMEFVDNGYSGANFERPAIQKMLELVRQNRINCVMVKDFTRFGRNVIETGYLVERVFPLFRVRFISVNNDFDSINYKGDTGGMEVAFQYLISEYYSRDLSVKSKSARYAKMRRGEYQSKICPYGYFKGEDGCLAIDEEAARVVKLTFTLASEGMTGAEVARELYRRKIPTPAEYKAKKGAKVSCDISLVKGVWSNSTVLRILEDERYAGTYIMGKRTVTDVGASTVRLKDESLWFKIPNHHPAIVDMALFEEAKKNILRFRIPRKKQKQYPLKGKVFCGNCGHALFRTNYTNPAYYCRYSKTSEDILCHHLKIFERDIEDILFETMKKTAQMILAVDDFSIGNNVITNSVEQAGLEKRVSELEDYKRSLYESLILGSIGSDEYKALKSRCDAELLHAKQLCGTLLSSVKSIQQENDAKKELCFAAKSVTNENGLSKALVDLLIERVDIYPGNLIDITWKIKDFTCDAQLPLYSSNKI